MEGNGRGSSSLRCESVKVASNQTSGLSPPGRIIVLMSFSHRILLSLLPIPRNYIVIFHIVNRRRHRPWIDRENFTRAFFWSVDRVTHSRATASGQLASSVILSNYYIRRSYFSMQRDALHRFRFHELAFSMRWGAICFSSVSLSQRTGQSFKERDTGCFQWYPTILFFAVVCRFEPLSGNQNLWTGYMFPG